MRLFLALLAFAPSAAFACAMPSEMRLAHALADIDEELAPAPSPDAENRARVAAVVPAPLVPPQAVIAEATSRPMVQPAR